MEEVVLRLLAVVAVAGQRLVRVAVVLKPVLAAQEAVAEGDDPVAVVAVQHIPGLAAVANRL